MKPMKTMTTLPLFPCFALLSALSLSACGPEGDFEDAINATLSSKKKCWNISSSRQVTFPITVKRSFLDSQNVNPILAGLEAQGLVEIEQVKNGYIPADKVDLTPAGERESIWTDGEGFCVGTPEVVEVTRYTFGDNGQNENAAQVEFTYQYTDLPSWLDRDAFAAIPGMVEPDEGMAEAQKSSDGWHATAWF